MGVMAPSTHLLAEALGLAALIAATIEYIEIVRRRTDQRLDRDVALRGLVRVFAVGDLGHRAARRRAFATPKR
jgi:hypothetical protein